MEKIATATRRIHPLIAGAAISVTVLSLVGTAAIAGWLPTSKATATPGGAAPNGALAADLAPGATPLAPEAAPLPQQRELPAPQPVAHHSQHTHHATQVAQAAPSDYERRPQAQPEPAPAPKQPNYVGIGAGAVIGGLLGNQVGGGRGRTAATIAGAIGGGLLGNHIQDQQQQPQR